MDLLDIIDLVQLMNKVLKQSLDLKPKQATVMRQKISQTEANAVQNAVTVENYQITPCAAEDNLGFSCHNTRYTTKKIND
jgi:hypothetical protein